MYTSESLYIFPFINASLKEQDKGKPLFGSQENSMLCMKVETENKMF